MAEREKERERERASESEGSLRPAATIAYSYYRMKPQASSLLPTATTARSLQLLVLEALSY